MTRNPLHAGALLFSAVLLLVGSGLLAQQEDPLAATDRQILTEIAEHSEQMANLEHLTDRIGPRLTGSPGMKRANEWTAERFRTYGLSNVHLEAWTIAHAWRRGTARARVLVPAEQALAAEAAGWSPNTPGPVRGRLLYVKAEKKEDLEGYRGKLRGAIVVTAEPQPRQRVQERPLVPRPPRPERDFAALRRFAQERDEFFKAEGVQAVLRDSDKSFGLFNMSAVGRDYQPAPLPTAFLTPESYDLLWRLRKNEQLVEVELDIAGSEFSPDPVEVYNTVAEIPGGEKPEEVVILGAHLDSWDLGTGATDNGTGVSVVLEVARALKKLDLKPKRTLRFILFSGEEQGLNGSRAYVEAHKEEMAKVSAVLVHDYGSGRVETIALQGNPQVYEVVSKIVAPLRQMIGFEELSLRSISGSDHASFNRVGVPGFFCQQERATYGQTHHSQGDTFDKIVREDLLNGAQVLAVFAYNVAQLEDMLPRRPVSPTPAP
ncbi:MAG: M20/M25/M40 family metallo-hydrolase [Acidobacteria bacterium]|nr:M20/M25/M40 family metallo-hydrolase [Acidobacteriota bacterium]